jgi:hypothetical protein
MKTFIVEDKEKERIKLLYESKGIILNEDGIWGSVAKVARRLGLQSEDDIARVLRSSEAGILKSLDDIILPAIKSKNITPLNDIQAKVMHFYNPSGSAEGVTAAGEQVKKFLNGYAKAKGKLNWKVVKDEVSGVPPSNSPKPQPQNKPTNDDFVQVRQNPIGGLAGNKFSNKRISNRSFGTDQDWYKDIDFNQIKNWGGSIDNYNKEIAKAIKTGNYDYISKKGFEKFGIIDFRDFLKNNIKTVNEVIPETGRWSVTFK